MDISIDEWFEIKKVLQERLSETDADDIADYFGELAGLGKGLYNKLTGDSCDARIAAMIDQARQIQGEGLLIKSIYKFRPDIRYKIPRLSLSDNLKSLPNKISKDISSNVGSVKLVDQQSGGYTKSFHDTAPPKKSRTLRIFLGYTREDEYQVRLLYTKLLNDGFDPWIDKEKLVAGQDWQTEITLAVNNSDVFLACLSLNSLSKVGYFQKELRYAYEVAQLQPAGMIYLIPIRLENFAIPQQYKDLRRYHWVDLFEPTGYQMLVKALNLRVLTIVSEEFHDQKGQPFKIISRQDREKAKKDFKRGMTYYNQKDFDLAIEAFDSAISLYPKFVDALLQRGRSYHDAEEYDQAISDYTQAISFNPLFEMPYYERGLSYAYKGELDLAMADYNKALSIYTSFPNAYVSRGCVYHRRGDFNKAIADFTQALQLDSRSEFANRFRGESYAVIGEYDLAFDDYSKAIALDPKDAETLCARGSLYKRKGDIKSAQRDFQLSAELGHSHAEKELQALMTSGYNDSHDGFSEIK